MSGPPETTNPAATAMANGVLVGAYPSRKRPKDPSSKPRGDKPKLTVRVAGDGPTVTVTGREAQTLALLIQSGPTGFTSGEASPLRWARRPSAYVHTLRGLGIPISTRRETTPDGASVARYALAGPVVVVNGGEA